MCACAADWHYNTRVSDCALCVHMHTFDSVPNTSRSSKGQLATSEFGPCDVQFLLAMPSEKDILDVCTMLSSLYDVVLSSIHTLQ